jgi:hypothetical protein
MNNKKIVFFSAFRNLVPSDYENWLESMAARGWHVSRFRQWSSMIMVFTRAEPGKYRFVYDIQVSPKQDYFSMYEEFGWEYLGRMASAHVWRMPYDEERPEAFSDSESLVKRTRRTIAAVSVSFFIFLMAVITIGLVLLFSAGALSETNQLHLVIAEGVFGLAAIALGSVMVILRKNQSR